jgi:hypothetical protein
VVCLDALERTQPPNTTVGLQHAVQYLTQPCHRDTDHLTALVKAMCDHGYCPVAVYHDVDYVYNTGYVHLLIFVDNCYVPLCFIVLYYVLLPCSCISRCRLCLNTGYATSPTLFANCDSVPLCYIVFYSCTMFFSNSSWFYPPTFVKRKRCDCIHSSCLYPLVSLIARAYTLCLSYSSCLYPLSLLCLCNT